MDGTRKPIRDALEVPQSPGNPPSDGNADSSPLATICDLPIPAVTRSVTHPLDAEIGAGGHPRQRGETLCANGSHAGEPCPSGAPCTVRNGSQAGTCE